LAETCLFSKFENCIFGRRLWEASLANKSYQRSHLHCAATDWLVLLPIVLCRARSLGAATDWLVLPPNTFFGITLSFTPHFQEGSAGPASGRPEVIEPSIVEGEKESVIQAEVGE
jgi:hypothetical protein